MVHLFSAKSIKKFGDRHLLSALQAMGFAENVGSEPLLAVFIGLSIRENCSGNVPLPLGEGGCTPHPALRATFSQREKDPSLDFG